MAYPVGIDFGTTYSSVCQYINGRPEMKITNENNSPKFPSIIGYDEGEWIFANGQVGNCIKDIKRLIGVEYGSDEYNSILPLFQEQNLILREEIIPEGSPPVNKKGTEIKFGDHFYNYKKLIAKYINWLFTECEGTYSDQKIVATMPLFKDLTKNDTIMEIYTEAGFRNITLLAEPIAAALAVCINNYKNQNFDKLLVFDFGGGTLDITILSVTYQNDIPNINDIGNKGEPFLGGIDFDLKLCNWTLQQLRSKGFNNIDTNLNSEDIKKIMENCEKAKKALSNNPNSRPSIINSGTSIFGSVCREAIKIDINTFETICEPIFNRILEPAIRLLEEKNITKEQIDGILLVGGSSKIRKVKQIVEEYFQKSVLNYTNIVNPVALGACLKAASMTPGINIISDIRFEEVPPNQPRIGFPIRQVLSYSVGTNIHNEDNPSDPLFSPILYAGIDCYGGEPKSGLYRTITDNQDSVRIDIIECNGKYCREGKTYQTFYHRNLTPRPAGKTEIVIEFKLDENGLLTISSREKGQMEFIVRSVQLLKDEVRRLTQNDFQSERQRRQAERLFDATLLISLSDFFKDDLPDLIANSPNFSNEVDIEGLKRQEEIVDYYLTNDVELTEVAINSIILEGRRILSPYYSSRNQRIPDLFL